MIDNAFARKRNEQPPLLVDLDGSLIATDTLYETLVLLAKAKPWMLIFVPIWFLQGKQHLKRELFNRTNLNVDSLPYQKDVVNYLKGQHGSGRNIILATGSWHEIAKGVCEKFPFIDDYVATDETVNLTGSNKSHWAVDKFGAHGFDYLGNEDKDLAVWKDSRKSIVVGNNQLVANAVEVSELGDHIPIERAGLRTYLKAIRLHQWTKNALLFVPLLTAHLFTDLSMIFQVLIGFVCFGCCASATYIINDLFDLESDRDHPIKRFRPLASGKLSIPKGIAICGLLLGTGLLLGLMLNAYFFAVLLAYLVVTILYSFKLKTLQTVDVITLAGLFTLRVIAGAAAIKVAPSFWLLSFSMFLFLSLAIVKRVSEIIRVESQASEDVNKISGRGYFTNDADILQSLGTSSGFLSVLVFALYINSDQVIQMYNRPELLWLMCPILGYWVMRIWMLASRGQMNEDPISFAITDKNSIFCGGLMAAVLVGGSLL